jgi:hypothetical protein
MIKFSHHKLDAFEIAMEALVRCDAIAGKLPRGYGPMADQLKRSSQSAYLQYCEGANRCGPMRRRDSVALAAKAEKLRRRSRRSCA